MAKNTIELKIVTPEEILLQEVIEKVSIPTVEGEITILPNHIPLMSAMKPGELKIVRDGKQEFFSVTKGVIEVDGKSITILTDAAERAEAIDEKRAEEATKRAEEIMSQKRHEEEGYVDAVAELERALSRIKIVRKRKSRGKTTQRFDQ